MRPDRWEMGSDYHAVAVGWSAENSPAWLGHSHQFLGTGRHAVTLLGRGFRRLWVPSFFCQDVVRSWAASGLTVSTYPDSPLEEPSAVVPAVGGDLVVAVGYFGIRRPPKIEAGDGVVVIEDHTHDPFSEHAVRCATTYAFASLRKTLPVPDGAVVWSPAGNTLPDPDVLAEAPTGACLDRLTAMLLKARYLRGERISKDTYREQAMRGELGLSHGRPSRTSEYAQALLRGFPFSDWVQRRRSNWDSLKQMLQDRVEILEPGDKLSTPFSLVLRLPSRHERDRVRRALIRNRIYPAVLWNLDNPAVGGIPEHHRRLASQLLSLHCDARYAMPDLERAADCLAEVVS